MTQPNEEPLNGVDRIAQERKRQIEEENWTPEHDDEHGNGELAVAAACYASPALLYKQEQYANEVHYVDPWPWEEKWDKRPRRGEGSNVVAPNDPFYVSIDERIRMLEKAGALVAAEIDRLLRNKISRRQRDAQ